VVSLAEALDGIKEINRIRVSKNLIVFLELIEAKILPIGTNLVIASR
jgi:hypothetical protein